MSSRYPPQSRMPTLVPQRTETLWYPRQKGVENMQDELLQEEAVYEEAQKDIVQSGSHYIPAGLSKRYVDLKEEEQDEEEEEEEEEDEDEEEDEEQVQVEGQTREFQELLLHERAQAQGEQDLDLDFGPETEAYSDNAQEIYSPTRDDDVELDAEERDLDDDIEEAASYTLSDDDNDDTPHGSSSARV